MVGQKCVLTPKDAEVVGRFKDGSCAAALRKLGRGRTLLLGFMPGLAYGHNAPRRNRPATDTSLRDEPGDASAAGPHGVDRGKAPGINMLA